MSKYFLSVSIPCMFNEISPKADKSSTIIFGWAVQAVRALEAVSPHQMASAIPGLQCISRKTSLAGTLEKAYGDRAWEITPRFVSSQLGWLASLAVAVAFSSSLEIQTPDLRASSCSNLFCKLSSHVALYQPMVGAVNPAVDECQNSPACPCAMCQRSTFMVCRNVPSFALQLFS